jgi:MscS family membrane protein
LPEVYVEKVGNQWLYSEETMNAIAKLHREVYPFGTDVLINLIPKGGQSKVLGIKIWQIVGILGLLIVVFLIHKITTYLFRLLLRRLLKTRAKAAILDPKLIFSIARLSSIILMVWILIRLLPILQFPVEIVSTIIIGLRIMRTVFVILLGFKLVDLLALYVKRATDKTENTLDNQIVPIIRQSLDIIIGVIGVIVILNYLKVNVTALIAGISIGGLALALAAQETVKNLIGSVMIFIDRPFQIGDYIVTKSASGTVEEVGFRSTRIRSAENSVLTIPNGTLANMVIDNFGLRVYRRYKTDLTLTYNTSSENITAFVEGIKTIIAEHPKTRKEGFQVHFNNLSASSLDILLIVYFQVADWTEELESRQDLLLSILKLAKEIGVEFAYPTTSVHLVNPDK